MLRPMASPTLLDIARHLGVSKMTVSRALRGKPHVSAEMRKRVAHAAEALGYQPDPELAKLMHHMRRGRARAVPAKLAFVWSEREAVDIEASSWSQQLLRGAQQQARRLGFELEEFHLAARGMSGRRLSGILTARGIPGFILSPLVTRSRGHVSMRWESFSSVVIGLGYARPALHRVHHHHFLGMMTALRMLRKQGHRRIGFYCPATINERMYRAWSASFLAHHPLPQPEELLALRKTMTQADFHAWVRQTRPQVVIDASHALKPWIERLPAAQRPLHVTLCWHATVPEVAGIDQQAEVLGAAAVDLLVAQFQQNERGLPAAPKMVMTEGVWRRAEDCA